MAALLQVVSWPTFGIAIVVFGFAPGAVLRLIALAFPKGDPRRHELLGELPAVPRLERPFWVAEQLEVALFEGVRHRLARVLPGRMPKLRAAMRDGTRASAVTPAGPFIRYGLIARFSDIWSARRDGHSVIPPLPGPGSTIPYLVLLNTIITPYMHAHNRHFVDRAELERRKMHIELAEIYQRQAKIKEEVAGAEAQAASLRAEAAGIDAKIAAREEILYAQVRQLHQHALLRCGTYMQHIVHYHPEGSAVIPYLKLALPELPEWIPVPPRDGGQPSAKTVS
jgi:hypothetical protein